MLVVTAGILAWVFSAPARAEAAAGHDAKMQSALQRGDIDKAFQEATYANALKRTDRREVERGSLAYLRRDYRKAIKGFQAVDDSSALTENARVGLVLAAAAEGDRKTYDRLASKAFDGPETKLMALRAALDIGDVDRLKNACTCLATNRTGAYLLAVGKVAADPAAAREVAGALTRPTPVAASDLPAFKRLAEESLKVDESEVSVLSATIERTAVVASLSARKAMVAQAFLSARHYRLSKSLARSAVRESPLYRDGWNVVAAAQIGLREFKDARDSLKTSRDLDRAFAPTWRLMAELARAEGDESKAAEYSKKAKSLEA